MTIQLTREAIDLGIVIRESEPMLAFYRDTLGFTHEGDAPMPGDGVMHRLRCGQSLVKLVRSGRIPEASNPPNGIGGATGMRYWTIHVSNLEELTKACESAGYKVAVSPREFRPGVWIAIVEDPEGNWVEFAQGG